MYTFARAHTVSGSTGFNIEPGCTSRDERRDTSMLAAELISYVTTQHCGRLACYVPGEH